MDPRAEPACGGRFSRLAAVLEAAGPVVVQTHDYPDIDAVASAWSLAELLRTRGFKACAAYQGKIRSRSLLRLIAELGVALEDEPETRPDLQVVVVDGSPANGNVTLLPGSLVGVVDHHNMKAEPQAPFVDIRPEFASCSSLIYSYWAEEGLDPPSLLATALLAGIQSDTDFLSRRTSPGDIRAWTALTPLGEFDRASRIVRTIFDLRELDLAAKALAAAEVREGLYWTMLPGPSCQELLAVLAEFVLRAEELRAVVVAERDEEGIHLSIRSRDPRLSAFELATAALAGIGAGGGHSHSAGGFVPASRQLPPESLRERFFSAASHATKA